MARQQMCFVMLFCCELMLLLCTQIVLFWCLTQNHERESVCVDRIRIMGGERERGPSFVVFLGIQPSAQQGRAQVLCRGCSCGAHRVAAEASREGGTCQVLLLLSARRHVLAACMKAPGVWTQNLPFSLFALTQDSQKIVRCESCSQVIFRIISCISHVLGDATKLRISDDMFVFLNYTRCTVCKLGLS